MGLRTLKQGNQAESPNKTVLCVDLDGTLVKTDTLHELALRYLKLHPVIGIVSLILWAFKGRNILKLELSRALTLDVRLLPYNEAVLELLKAQREEGRTIWLVTGAAQGLAEAVAGHLGLFDRVIGTSDEVNLIGDSKRARLDELCADDGYDYLGDSSADIPVWRGAKSALVVARGVRYLDSVGHSKSVGVVGTNEPKRWFKALRIHQWAKNALIFAPALLAHRIFEVDVFMRSTGMFIAFSLVASGVYLLNDLLDLDADRVHASKSRRPFASGNLNLLHGSFASIGLFLSGLSISLVLGGSAALMLLGYVVLTTSYSFRLKRIFVLDIVLLSSLYTYRLMTGAVAGEVEASFWLVGFSTFVFLNLAIVKRVTELTELKEAGAQQTTGRAYHVSDLPSLSAALPATGAASVLVLALYLNSAAVTKLYASPVILWPVVLLALYWILRIGLLAVRGEIDSDPVAFALKDRVTYVVGALVLGLLALAS